MKYPTKIFSFLLLLVASSLAYGQMHNYDFKRELNGINEQWHKLVLPNELFEKTNQELTDIRIYGIANDQDTIEAPYILHLSNERKSSKKVKFKKINTSYNEQGFYFTFEIQKQEPINQIQLEFVEENFDWKVSLEGSQDQKEWFTIAKDQRILSIKNGSTDFQFTNLSFPTSKYLFFRLRIDSEEKPQLKVTSITQEEITAGKYNQYRPEKISIEENKKNKRTEIDVDLLFPARISQVKIKVSDDFDYYRPITIKYLADSFKTEKGWKYTYRTLTSATLNSIEKNEFKFKSTSIKKLKIDIENNNNQALSIDDIELKGYQYELVARFNEKATYYLTYGSKIGTKPIYDIQRFTKQIPKQLSSLGLGEERKIEKKAVSTQEPLFMNNNWLWAIMIVMIGLLGWFSIKMIRKS